MKTIATLTAAATAAVLAGASLALAAPASAGRTPRPAPSHGAPVYNVGGVVLPFGDSFTFGSNAEPQGGYRGPLATLQPGLQFVGTLTDAAGRRHEGHPGWTIWQLTVIAPDVLQQLTYQGEAVKPRDVLLYIGANDAGNGHDHSGAEMLADLGTLLDVVHLNAPGARVHVALISHVPINSMAQNTEVDVYNAGIPALAAARAPWVLVVDMRDLACSVTEGGDGVHPSPGADGYGRMAERFDASLRTPRQGF